MIRQSMISLLAILLISSCSTTPKEPKQQEQTTTTTTAAKWDVDSIQFNNLGETIYLYCNEEQTIISKISPEAINEAPKNRSMVFPTSTVYYKQVGDSLFLYVGKESIPNDLNTLNTKVKYFLRPIADAKEQENYKSNYLNLGMKKVK